MSNDATTRGWLRVSLVTVLVTVLVAVLVTTVVAGVTACGTPGAETLVVSPGAGVAPAGRTGAAGAQPAADGPKIAAPPAGTMYLGQYEWLEGDIEAVERALGRKVAMWSPFRVMTNDEGDPPTFDVEAAEEAWASGYAVYVYAYEAYPQPTFTVDRLLRGQYDRELRAVAAQFRAFGRPMFFETAREPNGSMTEAGYTGAGFGPDGTETLGWAVRRRRGFDQFSTDGLPNPHLYTDLGDPARCDSAERLVAAQRYYHDFFVRREGLTFLTFDTMGWAAEPPESVAANAAPGSYERRLLLDCADFGGSYPGDDYVDWVSIDWYLSDFDGPRRPVAYHVDKLEATMTRIREVAPGKPVLITELGFAAPDPASYARAVRAGLSTILEYPEIGGFVLWSDLAPEPTPYFLIAPGTSQASALRSVIDANPGRFLSCVRLTDGSTLPGCED